MFLYKLFYNKPTLKTSSDLIFRFTNTIFVQLVIRRYWYWFLSEMQRVTKTVVTMLQMLQLML